MRRAAVDDEFNERALSEATMATTRAVLGVFNLRPEEYRDAFDEVYPLVRSGLVQYLAARRRELTRLARTRPPEN